jgi:hypothetical protein
VYAHAVPEGPHTYTSLPAPSRPGRRQPHASGNRYDARLSVLGSGIFPGFRQEPIMLSKTRIPVPLLG